MFLLPKGTFPYREERQIGDTYNWIGLLCINDNNIVNVIKGNLVIKKGFPQQSSRSNTNMSKNSWRRLITILAMIMCVFDVQGFIASF